MLIRTILAVSVLIGAGVQPSQALKISALPEPPQQSGFDLLKERGVEHFFKVTGKHIYIVDLKKGQALQAIVQQDGVDVELDLYDPAGKLLTTIDSHNGKHGPEPVLWVAQETGRYRMVVSTGSAPSATAKYVIQVAERRPAKPKDMKRSLAMREYYKGRELLGRDPKKAAEVFLTSARDLEQAGDVDLCADAWQDLGLAYTNQQQWQSGIKAYERAVLLFHRLGKRRQEAILLNQSAGLAEKVSDVDKAQKLFKQGLRLAREVKDERTEASILTNLGELHAERGEAWEAASFLREAEQIWHTLKDPDGEANVLARYGLLYKQMGQVEEALDFYRRALLIPNVSSGIRAEILTRAGNAYVAAGNPDRAFQYFRQAIDIERRLHDLENEASTLDGVGLAFIAKKNFRDALGPYQQALNIYRALKDPRGEAITQMNIGWALGALQRYDDARDSFDRALGIARALKNPIWEAGVRLGFAWTERRRKRLSEAQHQAEKALALIEGVRNEIEDSKMRISFFSRKQDVYDLLVGVLMERAESRSSSELATNAFQVSESARARSLLDALGAKSTPVLSAKEVMQQVLDPDTVLLEYLLDDPKSYLWLVTLNRIEAFPLPARKEIEDLARDAYEGMAKSHLHEAQADTVRKSRKLSQMLLGPVAGQLGTKRLIIVASGSLQTLPFAALPDPATPDSALDPKRPWPPPLVVRHEIVVEPSASALSEIRRRRAGRQPSPGLLAVLADGVFERDDQRISGKLPARSGGGDPFLSHLDRLPGSRKEAEMISAGLPAKRVLKALGFLANRDLFMSGKLGEFQIVHIATHTFHPPNQPEQAAIVLSRFDERGRERDGLVRVADIGTLKLRSDLVVLSSCSSGVGKNVLGEGIMGLPQAFLSAGASGVVTSVWDVADESTAELMALFYRNLLALHMSPSLALQKAQVEMWRRAERNVPWFWAGFVAQGEWRSEMTSLNKVGANVSSRDGGPGNVLKTRKPLPAIPRR